VRLAEESVVVKGELLAGRQLSLARVTRETRQVIHVVTCLPDPVSGAEYPLALGALECTRSATI